MSRFVFLRLAMVALLALACCQRSAITPTRLPAADRDSPTQHMVVPDLGDCHRFADIRRSSEEDDERWHRARDLCASVLKRRAAHIMQLFHAGDCDGLVAFANGGARRAEARFVAYLLDDLNDERAGKLFLRMFPLDQSDSLDHVEALRQMSEFLGPEEGCQPSLCRTGREPACSPWFGLQAPGACVAVRVGPAEGCMPAYCMEDDELLIRAARRNWDGTRALLVDELAKAGGYVWGSLCHCGVRADVAESVAWESLASGPEEQEALQSCFADMRGNTTVSCRTVKERKSGRVCGQPSTGTATMSGRSATGVH